MIQSYQELEKKQFQFLLLRKQPRIDTILKIDNKLMKK